jgi:putative endonuclease
MAAPRGTPSPSARGGSSRAIGAEAERRAAEFLRRRGFVVLAANYTCKGGELDLVCDDGGTVVFVEVRARRGAEFGAPEETISALKRRRVVLAARHWLARNGGEARACRFDVVAIEGDAIRHLPDAFGV